MNTLQSSHTTGGGGGKLKSENALEELVSITPNERNWRGICIALLVIIAVLALILFFIVLLSPPYEGPFNPGIKFTIDHVTGSEFKSSPFNGTWISETEFVFRDPNGGVSIFNARNNTAKILINNSTFRMSNGIDFMVSADLKYVLIIKDIKKIHTNTKKAKYRIQEVHSPNHISLTPHLVKTVHEHEVPYIEEVAWSPRGNALAFVYKQNVFYKPEVLSNTVLYQITYSGSNFVFNGVPDWLYQEEITKKKKCMWFSPDGRYLAFATFNDTKVREFKYPVFKTNYQYPEIFSLFYPKVGTRNPDAYVSVTDISTVKNGSYITLQKPKAFLDSESYLINVVWSETNQIAVTWMNREQTTFIISICTGPNWNCQDAHVETATENSWVDPNVDMMFSKTGNGFLTILSVLDGTAGKFPQLCHIDISTKIMTPLTHGQIVVTNIKAWDQSNHVVYFEAAPEGKPTQRHVYNVSDSLTLTNKWHCLTCPVIEATNNITNSTLDNFSTLLSRNASSSVKSKNNTAPKWPVRSNSCRYVRSYFHQFNQPISYYIIDCLGPDVPKTILMNAVTDTPSLLLNNQTELAARYAKMAKPQLKILQVELDTGYIAQVKILLPPIMRERLEMEFPFILYVGSSPGSQGVTEEWLIDWNTYLVSNLNFVVGIIDARGSSCQSDEMKNEINKKFGIVDVEDQLSVLLYLRDTLKYIDRTRIGVWGRGYGGYVTGRLLEQDNGTFHCGIAIAPVTSWAHYVSVWTERFMGTQNVTDNYRGYEESDLTKKVANFRDKKFLLIHGTADKLVHYQHSMLLVHSFSKQGILFRHLTYPDEDHDFSGANHHVIKAMETFWNDCFGPIEYEDYDEGLAFLSFAQ
ncbi:inactive dipeptidyl peptidase 10-like isoform X2 [Planococcus citri]|uniref:inactive dipeptidyl peptidase 10-like isoform X2 n=1 Tax=Planococcus citri TaxID=170843 RepID=UPI0031F77C5D